MGLPIIRSAVDNGLRARLRAATSRAHAGLDDDLSARLQAPGGYHAYLRGMHAFLCSLLPGVREAAAGMGWPLPAWEQALERDLAHLRLTPLAPEPGRTVNRAATLGALYVVEGAGLGARVLLRRAKALGYGQDCGATFLHLHADGDGGTRWPRFQALLASADGGDAEAACRSARRAFGVASRSFLRAMES